MILTLKKLTHYAQLTRPDYRVILLRCLKIQISQEVIKGVKALSTDNDKLPSNNADGQDFYFWA